LEAKHWMSALGHCPRQGQKEMTQNPNQAEGKHRTQAEKDALEIQFNKICIQNAAGHLSLPKLLP